MSDWGRERKRERGREREMVGEREREREWSFDMDSPVCILYSPTQATEASQQDDQRANQDECMHPRWPPCHYHRWEMSGREREKREDCWLATCYFTQLYTVE